ncbi:PPPDE putative peptidase domain-containing protein [Gilbertella persicaria]|uniref:PPPDE domain-containing protein n=1 Tax=Rhizopus stolonifer TaxID=4846 RepID=A0A367KTC0_RHIST|nr:PPPDE putative peptidase domain-containing protein [Gilbertella persicaria]KAI8078952.1 PPPDE putative peptidase domain-containing protein [Gilbertella persicaria]RCI05448.1 hypothetical protein CU098_009955 [Rhizopus stolonifer]
MFNLIKSALNKSEVDSEQEKRKITLNVYDMLQPGFLTNLGFLLGIGIYHSGIEIGEHEYCFGGHDYEHVTGVFMVKPKVGPQGLLFKQSIHMGYTNLTQREIEQVLQDISKEYMGTSYKLLTRNCNHFSEDLCKRLTGKAAPGWINRAAKLGTMFPCVIPTEWIEPPEADNSLNAPLKTPPPMRTKKESSESLVKTTLENDAFDYSLKEPDTHRPEVIRSATQLSITAPIHNK